MGDLQGLGEDRFGLFVDFVLQVEVGQLDVTGQIVRVPGDGLLQLLDLGLSSTAAAPAAVGFFLPASAGKRSRVFSTARLAIARCTASSPGRICSQRCKQAMAWLYCFRSFSAWRSAN